MSQSRLLVICLFFLLTGSHLAQGQLVQDKDSLTHPDLSQVNLSSPYHSTLTFFHFLEDENFHPAKAAQTLDLSGISETEGGTLSIKLKQIFEGKGVIIQTQDLPKDPDYQDSLGLTKDQLFYFDKSLLPTVFMEKVGQQWKFSSYTVANIEAIHKQTYPFGTDRLLRLLPKIGNDTYLGLHLWQLVGILLIALFVILSHYIITFLVDKGLVYLLQKFNYQKVGENYLLPVARVVSYYLILLILSLLLPVLRLPVEIWSWVLIFLRTAKPFVITIIFYRLVNVLAAYFAKMALKTESTLDDQLVPLLRKTLKALVILVGTLFILQNGFDLDIIPFLTGLSIGGVAIALAAQDTIKNFFGSIMIFIDKPFQMGDWVTSGEIDGTVEEVGFRSTRIRTFRNSVMYVPNGKMADAIIDNHGLRRYRRFYTTLTITYDTPPPLVDAFVKGLKEIVLAHPDTRKDYFNVYFNNLSTYSLDVMFYIFFEVPTWPEELRCRHELLLKIIQLANSLGVRFAFPTQTLHMESFPEKKGWTPEYEGDEASYRKKLSDFFQQELKKKIE